MLEALAEFIEPASGVDQLVLAGVEGVAGRADFDFQSGLGGASSKSRAAGAGYLNRAVVGGVNIGLHKP